MSPNNRYQDALASTDAAKAEIRTISMREPSTCKSKCFPVSTTAAIATHLIALQCLQRQACGHGA